MQPTGSHAQLLKRASKDVFILILKTSGPAMATSLGASPQGCDRVGCQGRPSLRGVQASGEPAATTAALLRRPLPARPPRWPRATQRTPPPQRPRNAATPGSALPSSDPQKPDREEAKWLPPTSWGPSPGCPSSGGPRGTEGCEGLWGLSQDPDRAPSQLCRAPVGPRKVAPTQELLRSGARTRPCSGPCVSARTVPAVAGTLRSWPEAPARSPQGPRAPPSSARARLVRTCDETPHAWSPQARRAAQARTRVGLASSSPRRTCEGPPRVPSWAGTRQRPRPPRHPRTRA